MGKDSPGTDSRRSHLSYSFFQNIEVVGKPLAGICQLILPMFHGILTDNVSHIFHGDKRYLLRAADKCLRIGFHIYHVSGDMSQLRLYNWLLNHRHFGPYIRNFRENKAIPLRAKIISLVLMWGTMLYCIFFLIPFIWVKILLGLIAAGVTYHILSFKTLK